MTKTKLTVIFYYKQTGKYALNVIAGALMVRQALRSIPVYFASSGEDLLETIEQHRKHAQRLVVCWSFYSPQFNDIRNELASLKQQLQKLKLTFPTIIQLAGGVHATAEPQQTLAAGFDFVAVGEGEQTINDFMDALLRDQPVDKLRGIAWLQDGLLRKNGKGSNIDLNDYPPCASRYKKFGPIEITRGCIYACRFCQTPFVNKAKFRHRSVENTAHYVRIMRANGLRDYRFITPTSFSYGSADESVNLDAIETLLSTVRRIIGKQRRIFFGTFPSEIRPEHVTPKALYTLKKYVDNDNIIIGGQSGSQTVLDNSHRGHDVSSIIQAVKTAIKCGFQPNVDFLFGLPGETEQDATATVKLAEQLAHLGAKIHNHSFMPLPGTPFKNETAGNIDAQTQQQIVQLTSKGKAYGQWKGQLKIAKQLETLRKGNNTSG